MACLDVVFSPRDILPEADCWLVVDLLRATTTSVTFFELGGRRLLPVADLDEARSLRGRLAGRWLLMGERRALPPPGFDLGNSPLDLAAVDLSAFDGAVMTTTNGTAALLAAAGRGGVLHAACARNARAVAESVSAQDKIVILCAGLEGRPALDDTACAGLLVERLLALRSRNLADGARMALALFRSAPFADLVGQSRHGRRLADLGLAADLAYCCERDCSEDLVLLAFEGGRPVLVSGR